MFHLEIQKRANRSVGATGSGKSSIINVLMDFYPISSGNIYFDGIEYRTIDTESL